MRNEGESNTQRMDQWPALHTAAHWQNRAQTGPFFACNKDFANVHKLKHTLKCSVVPFKNPEVLNALINHL